MAKQSNKIQLLSDIKIEHHRLENTLIGLSREDMMFPGVVNNWSIKDILAHLTAWEQLLIRWYQTGLRNETPIPSPVGMSRLAINQLNQHIYEEHQQDSLGKVWAEFQDSYQQIITMIEKIPEGDMFENKRFPWTGRWTLADYIAGNTCNHYAWAKTKISRSVKERNRSKSDSDGLGESKLSDRNGKQR